MGQDNPKLQKIRDYARTAVLEKEENEKAEQTNIEQDDTFNKLNLFSNEILQNTNVEKQVETQDDVSHSNNAPDYTKSTAVEKQVKKENKPIETIQKEKRQENKQKKELEITGENKEEIEDKVETLFNSSLTLEQTGEEVIQKELSTYTKKSNDYKFKFKLLTCVFCCLLAILGGWIIGNAVEISSTSSQIATEVGKGEEYQVNIIEYLTKIGKLDDNVNQTPPNPENGSLFPIDEIIPITPQPLEDTTAYEQESNWFDKICNWFKNLFGG